MCEGCSLTAVCSFAMQDGMVYLTMVTPRYSLEQVAYTIDEVNYVALHSICGANQLVDCLIKSTIGTILN